MNSLIVRIGALLWMFPIYPALIALGWLVAVPLVLLAALFTKAAQPKEMVAQMWAYTWTDVPRRYSAAWQQLITGIYK